MQKHRRCRILNSAEWNRLKKQAGQPTKSAERAHNEEKQKYLKAMIEQSKAWTKNWPDTVEGCVALHEKHKAEQCAKNLTAFREFQKRKKQMKLDSARLTEEAIAKAREQIFFKSSDGRQLISAIYESKAIEEWEAQIAFKKYREEMEATAEKRLSDKIASMDNNLYDFSQKDEQKIKNNKTIVAEHAKINKAMHEKHIKELAEEKEQQIKGDLEDARLMKQLLDYEKHAMDHCKQHEKQQLEQYEADQKELREKKLKAERTSDAINEVWQNYNDRVRCMEKRVWDKIIKHRFESDNYEKNCEWIAKAQEKDKKSYENFVETGVKMLEIIQSKKDKNDQTKLQESKAKAIEMAKQGRMAEELIIASKLCNKCICDRQSLFTKSGQRVIKEVRGAEYAPEREQQSFLEPNKKLSESLKKRAKEPSPWTGVGSAHAQFAKHASATLKECKYKTLARKVVKNYKQVNCLDSAALGISED